MPTEGRAAFPAVQEHLYFLAMPDVHARTEMAQPHAGGFYPSFLIIRLNLFLVEVPVMAQRSPDRSLLRPWRRRTDHSPPRPGQRIPLGSKWLPPHRMRAMRPAVNRGFSTLADCAMDPVYFVIERYSERCRDRPVLAANDGYRRDRHSMTAPPGEWLHHQICAAPSPSRLASP